MRRNVVLGAVAAVVASLVVSAPADASSPCLHLKKHELEVCTAYVVNASYGARAPFYQLGGSTNDAIATAARNRLESRYIGAARSKIESQVSGWPEGRLVVSPPSIRIKSVRVSLDTDQAVLHTVESWKVRTSKGKVLFRESKRAHTITLKRVQGLVLHKWVVASF